MTEAHRNEESHLSAHACAQRERILCAAQHCFIRCGFHAASMAAIAEAAGMSAGLIYRYFENKNAIIQAIIARQLEEGTKVAGQIHSAEALAGALLEIFMRWKQGDHPDKNAAQLLDITAAATRDREIAEMVRASDAEIGRQIAEVLRRSAERDGFTLNDAQIRGRAALLKGLILGLAALSIRDPALERSVLEEPLLAIIGQLMHR